MGRPLALAASELANLWSRSRRCRSHRTRDARRPRWRLGHQPGGHVQGPTLAGSGFGRRHNAKYRTCDRLPGTRTTSLQISSAASSDSMAASRSVALMDRTALARWDFDIPRSREPSITWKMRSRGAGFGLIVFCGATTGSAFAGCTSGGSTSVVGGSIVSRTNRPKNRDKRAGNRGESFRLISIRGESVLCVSVVIMR